MNKQRRKALDALLVKLEELTSDLNMLAGEEQEYADTMPENMQGNERHSKAEEQAQELESVAQDMDELAERIRTVVQE